MARHSFVERDGLAGEPRPLVRFVGVRVVGARPRAVERRREVVRDRAARRVGLGDRRDLALFRRQVREPPRGDGFRTGDRVPRRGQQLVAVAPAQGGIGAQPFEDLGEVGGAEHLLAEFAVLGPELFDQRQPGLVQFLRGALGGRLRADQRGVPLRPARDVPDPGRGVGPPGGLDLRAQEVAVARVRRVDDLREQPVALGFEAFDGRGRAHLERIPLRRGEVAVQVLGADAREVRGRHEPVGEALALPLGQRLQERLDPGEPGQVAACLLLVVQLVVRQVHQQFERGRGEPVADRDVGRARAQPVGLDLGGGDDDLARDGFFRGQAVGRQRPRAGREPGVGGPEAVLRGAALVGEAVVAAGQPEYRRAQWLLLELQLDELARQSADGVAVPGHPLVDDRGEHRQRQRAAGQDEVVERPDVEPRAEPFGGASAVPLDLQPPHHVRQRLARPSDVAVDLGLDLGARLRRVRQQVVDGLLPAPAQRVQPGVDDQPSRPQRVAGQHAEPGDVVGVEPHLLREALAVEPPALDVGGEAADAAQQRQLGEPLGDAELEVVPRHGFVERGRLGHVPEPLGGLVGVREVDAGPGAVGGRAQVVRRGRAGRDLRRDRFDRALLFGDAAEPLRRFGGRPRDGRAGGVQQVVGAAPAQRRVGAQALEDLAEVVGAEHPLPQLAVLGGERVDDVEPDPVQFLGRVLRGRVHPRQAPVRLVATRQPRQAGPVFGPPVRLHLVGQERAVLREGRAHDVGEQLVPPSLEVLVRRRLAAQRVGRRVGEVAVEVGDRGVDQVGHRDQAVGDALGGPPGGLAEELRDGGEPPELRLRGLARGHGRHRQHHQQPGRGPDGEVGDGELGHPAVGRRDAVFGRGDQHLAGDPVFGREAVAVDRAGALQELREPRPERALGLGGLVRQTGFRRADAQERGHQRIGGEQRFDELVGEFGDRGHGQDPQFRSVSRR